ncbi:MAG TPA: signal recognition particle subunit SRP19/SEC65 family protein [Thermoplasmata archaeon]|nr:signal recognition particle subunit SRP19/SEC65 family protein [Thermoplasmata archaeon]
MPDHFYVYPAYLEKGLHRSNGRRVPEAEALVDPTSEEIVQAARRLGFRAEVEADKDYPARDYAFAGRVKVTKRAGTSKAKFLRVVISEVRKLRATAGKK